MATKILPLLLLFAVLVATASARPCKTLFYFSATTTTTYYPSDSLNRNPHNPTHLQFQIPNPRYITFIYTTTTTTSTASPRFPDRHSDRFNEIPQSSSSDFPLKFYSSVSSSVRDRTMDILSVVGALLFGVGCGAITAAVMYSLWALFNFRGVDFDEVSSSSDDEADDDITLAKKFGYVKMANDDLKKPSPPPPAATV